MKKLLISALAAATMAFGAATADVPLNISDMDEVTAGMRGHAARGNTFALRVAIKKDIDIDASLYARVDVFGNFADATAEASALGYDTFAETSTFSNVVQGYGSTASSASVSGASGYW